MVGLGPREKGFRIRLPSGADLLRDDFKGSFETFQSALAVLAEIPARRRLLLLGS